MVLLDLLKARDLLLVLPLRTPLCNLFLVSRLSHHSPPSLSTLAIIPRQVSYQCVSRSVSLRIALFTICSKICPNAIAASAAGSLRRRSPRKIVASESSDRSSTSSRWRLSSSDSSGLRIALAMMAVPLLHGAGVVRVVSEEISVQCDAADITFGHQGISASHPAQ